MHHFHPCAEKILLSGGLGDIMVLESHFAILLPTLKTIYWATRAQPLMQPLFEAVYPHLDHVNMVDEEWVWDKFWAFMSLDDVCARLPAFDRSKRRYQLEDQLRDVEDWSIAIIFPMLSQLPFQGSSFLKHQMADIARFDLPADYAVVQAYTAMNREHQRNARGYKPRDWDRTQAWLAQRNLPGVVLNVGDDSIPEGYVDLSNQTTLCEAIEVLKGAKAYIGIDGCFACLAAQRFENDMMQVMWRNTQYYTERYNYLAPKKEFGFLVHG